MTSELTPVSLPERLAVALAPIIEMEVQRRYGQLVLNQKGVVSDVDASIMRACRRVADAVDALDLAKFTAGEIPARRKLTQAAWHLRKAMQRKEAAK